LNAAGEEGFDSSSTMFLCNRWEMVPERDREAVKLDTMEKLSKFYTELKSSQMHYMSVTEVSSSNKIMACLQFTNTSF
jgi:hypothetical protein